MYLLIDLSSKPMIAMRHLAVPIQSNSKPAQVKGKKSTVTS